MVWLCVCKVANRTHSTLKKRTTLIRLLRRIIMILCYWFPLTIGLICLGVYRIYTGRFVDFSARMHAMDTTKRPGHNLPRTVHIRVLR